MERYTHQTYHFSASGGPKSAWEREDAEFRACEGREAFACHMSQVRLNPYIWNFQSNILKSYHIVLAKTWGFLVNNLTVTQVKKTALPDKPGMTVSCQQGYGSHGFLELHTLQMTYTDPIGFCCIISQTLILRTHPLTCPRLTRNRLPLGNTCNHAWWLYRSSIQRKPKDGNQWTSFVLSDFHVNQDTQELLAMLSDEGPSRRTTTAPTSAAPTPTPTPSRGVSPARSSKSLQVRAWKGKSSDSRKSIFGMKSIYTIYMNLYICLFAWVLFNRKTCRWSHCAGVWRITWTSTSCFGTYRTVGRSAEGEEGWEQEGAGKDRWCRERIRWGGSGERSTYCLPGWPTGHFI